MKQKTYFLHHQYDHILLASGSWTFTLEPSILYTWLVWYMLSGREDTYFYAPLEKGGILLCNYRSVGRSVTMSVCWSVDPVLSGQYLLTPSLDQYQTWCKGCPQWVDDPYWSLGHILIDQGQTTLLRPVCCLVIICWLLHLINSKLGAGVALNGYMIPIVFQVTCSKVKVKSLFSAHCVVSASTEKINLHRCLWNISCLDKHCQLPLPEAIVPASGTRNLQSFF